MDADKDPHTLTLALLLALGRSVVASGDFDGEGVVDGVTTREDGAPVRLCESETDALPHVEALSDEEALPHTDTVDDSDAGCDEMTAVKDRVVEAVGVVGGDDAAPVLDAHDVREALELMLTLAHTLVLTVMLSDVERLTLDDGVRVDVVVGASVEATPDAERLCDTLPLRDVEPEALVESVGLDEMDEQGETVVLVDGGCVVAIAVREFDEEPLADSGAEDATPEDEAHTLPDVEGDRDALALAEAHADTDALRDVLNETIVEALKLAESEAESEAEPEAELENVWTPSSRRAAMGGAAESGVVSSRNANTHAVRAPGRPMPRGKGSHT